MYGFECSHPIQSRRSTDSCTLPRRHQALKCKVLHLPIKKKEVACRAHPQPAWKLSLPSRAKPTGGACSPEITTNHPFLSGSWDFKWLELNMALCQQGATRKGGLLLSISERSLLTHICKDLRFGKRISFISVVCT